MSVIINRDNHLKYFDDTDISPEDIEQKKKVELAEKDCKTESTEETEDKPKIQFFTE